MIAVKFQHLFLSPFVILPIPAVALSGQHLAVTLLVAVVGASGMILRRQTLAAASSISLLVLLVWGKGAASLTKAASPDTALLLVEFTAVLVFLEASHVTLTFENDYAKLKPKQDELSELFRAQLQLWLRNQLTNQGKLALLSLGLSIILLPLAGITSISSDQLVISATLALMAVIILMLLVTHRRDRTFEG